MYVLTELGHVLIYEIRRKEKKCSFEKNLVAKSESSTRIENELGEDL